MPRKKKDKEFEDWYEFEDNEPDYDFDFKESNMNEGMVDAFKDNWMVWAVVFTIGYCVGMYVHHGMM